MSPEFLETRFFLPRIWGDPPTPGGGSSDKVQSPDLDLFSRVFRRLRRAGRGAVSLVRNQIDVFRPQDAFKH